MLDVQLVHALSVVIVEAEARGEVFALRRRLQRLERGELTMSDATRELRARYLALLTSRISAVRRPHRLHVTQRFTSSSSRPGPYCILSFTRLSFAER